MNKNQSYGTQRELFDVVVKDEGQGPLFRCALYSVRNYTQVVSLPIALAGYNLIAQAKTDSDETVVFTLVPFARLDTLRKLKAGEMKGKKVRVWLVGEQRRYAAAAFDDVDGASKHDDVARHPDISLSLNASRRRAQSLSLLKKRHGGIAAQPKCRRDGHLV